MLFCTLGETVQDVIQKKVHVEDIPVADLLVEVATHHQGLIKLVN